MRGLSDLSISTAPNNQGSEIMQAYLLDPDPWHTGDSYARQRPENPSENDRFSEYRPLNAGMSTKEFAISRLAGVLGEAETFPAGKRGN